MPSHISLLENGGTVLVVGGWNKAWASYRDNPRIIFWTGEQKEVARHVRNRSIPPNCRAVILSRFMSHTELSYILQDVRARRLTLFANKADGEVTELLEGMLQHVREVEGTQEPVQEIRQVIPPQILSTTQLPPQPTKEETMTPKRQVTKKGELNKVLQYVDWNKSNAENARALIDTGVLKTLEIKSTFGSLAQFIRVQRHKLGKPNVAYQGTGGKKPASRKATDKEILTGSWGKELDVTVGILDNVIKELHDIREFLVATTTENHELRKQNEKMKPLLEMIKALK